MVEERGWRRSEACQAQSQHPQLVDDRRQDSGESDQVNTLLNTTLLSAKHVSRFSSRLDITMDYSRRTILQGTQSEAREWTGV